MTKQNPYLIPKEVNKKPIEIVQEVNNEIPSYEEFLKTYQEGTNYDDLNTNDISEIKGYGSCSDQNCTCYIEQGFISLHLACPATDCSSGGRGEAYQWVHGSNCGGPIYINGNAVLKCMTCEKTGYITNWSFKCSSHPGEYLETTNDDCLNALGTVLRLYPNKPDNVKRIVRRVITRLMDNEGYTAGSLT